MKEIQIAKRADKGLFYVINENGRVDLIYREPGEEDLVIIDPTFEYVEYWLRDFDGEGYQYHRARRHELCERRVPVL